MLSKKVSFEITVENGCVVHVKGIEDFLYLIIDKDVDAKSINQVDEVCKHIHIDQDNVTEKDEISTNVFTYDGENIISLCINKDSIKETQDQKEIILPYFIPCSVEKPVLNRSIWAQDEIGNIWKTSYHEYLESMQEVYCFKYDAFIKAWRPDVTLTNE